MRQDEQKSAMELQAPYICECTCDYCQELKQVNYEPIIDDGYEITGDGLLTIEPSQLVQCKEGAK